jgi:hexosaminidase
VLVRAFLKNPAQDGSERQELENNFASWLKAAPDVQQQVSASPLLADAAGRAQQFADLAKIGSEAVKYLSGGSAAPAGWKQSSLAALDAAQKPQGLVRFTVLAPLRELVTAVQEK